MEELRAQIKKWLKENGKDRFWLADKCFVKKRTIDQWLSVDKIPLAKIELIKGIIDDSNDLIPQEPPYDFPNIDELGKLFVTLPPELQETVCEEAARLNTKTSAYCTLAVEWCSTTQEGKEAVEKLLQQKKNEDENAKKNPQRTKTVANPERHNAHLPENKRPDSPADTRKNTHPHTSLPDTYSQDDQAPDSPLIITGLNWQEENPA